jgi:hypothetical protein
MSAQGALVGHYEFEETGGTTLVDSSGSGFDGSVGTGGTLNVAGQIGSGYQDGSGDNQFGSITNGTTSYGINGNNARTIAFWFNASSLPGTSDQQRLIALGAPAPAESFDIVFENGTNANQNDGVSGDQTRVGLRYGNGNVYFNADNSGNDFAADTWYHVAFVYDGGGLDLEAIGNTADGTGLQVFVNGVQVSAAGGNLNNGTQNLNTTASDFDIGGVGGSTGNNRDRFDGRFDDLRIYNEALSSSAVAALVPEPGSLALLGLGGLCVLNRRRRG